jgi:hypothetical protein
MVSFWLLTINVTLRAKYQISALVLAPEGLERIARTFMSGRDYMKSPPI